MIIMDFVGIVMHIVHYSRCTLPPTMTTWVMWPYLHCIVVTSLSNIIIQIFLFLPYTGWDPLQIEGTTTFSVSSERHRQMWGERNCLSFETAVGTQIEPPSPRLTVPLATIWRPWPTLHTALCRDPSTCH